MHNRSHFHSFSPAVHSKRPCHEILRRKMLFLIEYPRSDVFGQLETSRQVFCSVLLDEVKVSIVISSRIFWLTSLTLSCIACSLLISKLVNKLQAYPFVIYLQENPVAVTDIPFPAVTLCPPLNLDSQSFDYRTLAPSIRNGETRFENLPLHV